ncbi:MAG: alkaline phosphatase family protein [Lachnospiraceae bacterium]|nr:alkaline phosphatase family protein [Lachnospiraceae bacterium]
MSEKVILILSDGLRPDAFEACGHPFAKTLLTKSSYSMDAQTVTPSVTLPCHMSLFHSVTPDRHGILTNTYTPQVRPVNGLCEQLRAAGKAASFFYNWGELRDLYQPDSLAVSYFASGHVYTYEKANVMVTDRALQDIPGQNLDFAFLYLGLTDAAGHNYGWMSEEYLSACYQSFEQIQRVFEAFEKDYTIIVTADHGGHGRMHGSTMPEDMTIPVICSGKSFTPGAKLSDVSILDIAPTITKLMDASPAPEWEGKALC